MWWEDLSENRERDIINIVTGNFFKIRSDLKEILRIDTQVTFSVTDRQMLPKFILDLKFEIICIYFV